MTRVREASGRRGIAEAAEGDSTVPRRRLSTRRSLPQLGLALGLTLAVMWLAAAAAIRLTHGGEVLPGTVMAERTLGGADREQVERQLASVAPPAGRVILTDAGRRFTVSPRAVGLAIDPEDSAERALRAGRNGLWSFLITPAVALAGERTVEPRYRIDQRAMRRVAAAIGRQLDRRPFPGRLIIDPAGLTVSIERPRPGRMLRRARLAELVVERLASGGTSAAALPVRQVPALPVGQVEAVAEQARAYLAAGPLRLSAVGASVVVTAAELAELLAVEQRARRLRLGVDPTATARLVRRIAGQRDRAARDARLIAPAAPVLLEDQGEVSWRPRPAQVTVEPARPGSRLDRRGAVRAIAAAVREGRHAATLPRKRVSPGLATASARQVRELIGTFTTRFVCCEPRVSNIRLMAEAVDGTVIAPGEQFSLNRVAGERTRARGFVPAPFISDGKVVPSVGGGVSQFSTTMYNAAFFAGVVLNAHQPHSFYIDRYPPGREATLDFGSIDLTWTNDTDAPILVRTATTDTSVSVSLYGDNGGRRVRAAASEREGVTGRDFSITVTRTIRYADGRLARQPTTTTYDKPPPPD